MLRLRSICIFGIVCCWLSSPTVISATPSNRIGLVKFYDRFLSKNLNTCTTCHLPSTSAKTPVSLAEFPHNPFGNRLRIAADQLRSLGKKTDIATRLMFIANEDSDWDGVDNITELLLGHAPGDKNDTPTALELKTAKSKRAEFAKFLGSYRWQPFDSVHRPAVHKTKSPLRNTNPIDAFITAEHEKHGLHPRPEATRTVLLRRVYFDLVGLSPTPEEMKIFESDTSPKAYEKVVDMLLASPRYGERWGRHWMDVWRYSDWAGWADGGQIRDSKPHIWRWRDWIVESLNADKGYDRMAQEMLAADEIAPENTDSLRATGFLVRNYKLLSREQWMEDTVGHTAKAFLGLTMHCAKCHDHMYDPISQRDYYRMRAIFEPHNVRTDRIPGQPDTAKDGLVRAYDADLKAQTFLFPRGDDRNPDKTQPIEPGVPGALGGSLHIASLKLSRFASQPDKRAFVLAETLSNAEKEDKTATENVAKLHADKAVSKLNIEIAELTLTVTQSKLAATKSVLNVERLEDAGQHKTEEWKKAASETLTAQRAQAVDEAKLNILTSHTALTTAAAGKPQIEAKAQLADAEKALKTALAELQKPDGTDYKPRAVSIYPVNSSGRRLAFARWLTDRQNPLTARVAVNHIWARHFGAGIVPSLSDFGRNGRLPSNPQLLDWLASEFMDSGWHMKSLHRLILTSRAYRMDSTNDIENARRDPDNTFLWRMSSRRMEAELVRDNLLYVSHALDETRGGPEIDHNLGLTSHRRSIYLRHAAEKQAEFLQIFDAPSVTECYERKPSVLPQQALALANSTLAQTQARELADTLQTSVGRDAGKFVSQAFLQILSRRPTPEERAICIQFLFEQAARIRGQHTLKTASVGVSVPNKQSSDPDLRARENLVLVLFNHNDFVTIR